MGKDGDASWIWVMVGLGLAGMFVVAGTFLAHWLWSTSWLVSIALAPVSLGALYVVFKIWYWLD